MTGGCLSREMGGGLSEEVTFELRPDDNRSLHTGDGVGAGVPGKESPGQKPGGSSAWSTAGSHPLLCRAAVNMRHKVK